jgi:hypothetical protein
MRLGLIPRKAASFAALLALLLQLAIAATHHHAVARGSSELIGDGQAFASSQDDGSTPSSADRCDICLGLALGASFVVPDAIAPDPDAAAAPTARDAPENRARTVLLAFRSRAPPAL